MDDRGFGSVMALALLFGGILLVGLASDVARMVGTWQQVSHVAHTAAEVGAGWASEDALYAGELELDRPAVRLAIRSYLGEVGMSGSARVTNRRVCVTVRTRVRPGITRLVGGRRQSVAVTACAEPRRG